MSSFWLYIGRTTILILVAGLLSLFPWPDISSFLIYFQRFVDLIYFVNPLVDIDTLFLSIKIVIGVEIIFLAWKILVACAHFITSGSFSGGAPDQD